MKEFIIILALAYIYTLMMLSSLVWPNKHCKEDGSVVELRRADYVLPIKQIVCYMRVVVK